ncbi:DUF7835 family putative zinc beta-ribbon protein [Haladaptatus halobius]|uniref:DUF7835 family putative zinc beta-ribbon protein n=1 Tax=Haladaptatus halobius TaxID=2884875 RepID=UPI001D0A225C|nr:hypothetical protein [Haladaptatus halobius]
MGAKRSADSQLVEQCDNCAAMTPHQVMIELITESEESQNAAFSREPYRITECQQCAATSKQRMNDM